MTGADREAWAFLVDQPIAILATVNHDGSAHVVPFTFAALGEGTLVSAVDEKPKSSRTLTRIENAKRDSRVTVLAHHYEDDWERLWWIRAEGSAEVSDLEPPGAALALVRRYPQYESHWLGPWLSITIERISRWQGDGGQAAP